ncbi:MAG: fumarylacetoacetate hydrolase family protein [Bacteroidales bacterium]|jgi:2-keto-4-pentenoate hydratase/2-oxohepta-3-ene-1,7-dioic acid hydratase in catechol pathway|nr:fumarylacetoacetate hydrolase family protein [Bacteroidales bacterium]
MKIVCIGRNYIEHANELKNPIPQKPIFFLKPDTALLIRNRPFFFPDFSNDIHYELELVFKVSKNGKNISEKFAPDYYNEIGLGIDFTARDLQQECKEKGLPWEIAKGFDQSAAISEFIPIESLSDPGNISFHLVMNGQTVQHGKSTDMIFGINIIISYVSSFMTLRAGDLIFTGTPAGVGSVKIGDKLQGYLEGKPMIYCDIK